ncbi:MAG: protein-L-isoaspartate(D-aspartate) O-methyltransferase [Candidatus Woesearchaeota archaeon]|jgi:protein-L-isoaspartate(D-aspartate) O-methyltransferase
MYEKERQLMVDMQLIKKGIKNEEVLTVMSEVPRHLFVPAVSRDLAYADLSIPIGHSQNMINPYLVARMIELLNPQNYERILEIGAGSGYVVAILSKMSDKVIGLEIIPELVESARTNLQVADVKNAKIINMEGSAGAMPYCPYDKILISAACSKIPEELLIQLKPNGVVVAPVGDRMKQVLVKATKTKNGFVEEKFDGCSFVPLVGKNGFKDK